MKTFRRAHDGGISDTNIDPDCFVSLQTVCFQPKELFECKTHLRKKGVCRERLALEWSSRDSLEPLERILAACEFTEFALLNCKYRPMFVRS